MIEKTPYRTGEHPEGPPVGGRSPLEDRAVVLPVRKGAPPRTTPAEPHEQLGQNGPSELRERLLGRARALPGVLEEESRVAPPGTRAFLLAPGHDGGPPQAFLSRGEFAHLHPSRDGSLHLALPRGLSDEVVGKGWGEMHLEIRHPRGLSSYLMVYAPRDERELEIVWRILLDSYGFARGGEPAPHAPEGAGDFVRRDARTRGPSSSL